MTDQNNENNQGSETDALNGLPDKERKETLEILDEIEKESAQNSTSKPEEKPDQKPDEGKPKDGDEKGKSDGKKPDLDEDKGKSKSESRREVKLIPAFIHEIEKKKLNSRISELQSEVETLTKGNSNRPDDGKSKDNHDEPDSEKEINEVAEKHGVSPELVKDMLALANKNGKLPSDVAEKLAEIDRLKNESSIKAEEQAFENDFSQKIVPLIKAEYGDNVPAGVINQIKEDLKAKAYTPEYEKVPFTVIYKGEDNFRGLIAPEKKGVEGGRGGTFNKENAEKAGGDQLDLTKPLADDVVRSLSDADFDTYCKNMESYERSKK